MLRCEHCGVEQPADDYMYCVNCGSELDPVTRIHVPLATDPVRQVPATAPVIVEKRSPVPWIIAGLAAVIAAVAITWAVMRQPQKEVVVQTVPVLSPTPAWTPGPPTGSPEVNFPTPSPSPANSNSANANAAKNSPKEPTTAAAEDDTALCNDGTYTKWQVISKACSANGGVRRWLVKGIESGKKARAICNDGHMSYFGGPRFLTCATSGGVRHWYEK